MLETVSGHEVLPMKFGEKLKELRNGTDMSQPAFAERVELTVGAVRDYEQGRRLPSWPVLVRIARVLGVTVDTFSDCDEVAVKPPKGKGKK
jgi:transcriptional regulator with XRE-family HTH domain